MNTSIFIYIIKNFTFLVSDFRVLWESTNALIFFLSLSTYTILSTILWVPISISIPPKKIFWISLAGIFSIVLFSHFTSIDDSSYTTKIHPKTENSTQEKRISLVVFLLESVNHKYFPKEKIVPFLKNEFTSVQEIPYFFVPTPHSSFSLFSLITGDYVKGGTKPNYRNVALHLGNLFIEKKIFYTQPSHVDSIDEMMEHFGFQVFDKNFYQKKKKFSEFSWGVDDIALVDSAIENRNSSSESFVHIYGFSNSHSPYFCNDSKELALERYQCAITKDIELIQKIISIYKEQQNRKIVYVILSDHGESFGEHGFLKHDFSLYNEEVRVPFWIFSETPIPNVSRYGSILDFYPSIYQLTHSTREPLNGSHFFQENRDWSIRLKSWNSEDYKGLIENQKKWIWYTKENKLWEMDLSDENIHLVETGKKAILDRIHQFAW